MTDILHYIHLLSTTVCNYNNILSSSDDIQLSTLITDSPTGLLLDIKVTGICFSHVLYSY